MFQFCVSNPSTWPTSYRVSQEHHAHNALTELSDGKVPVASERLSVLHLNLLCAHCSWLSPVSTLCWEQDSSCSWKVAPLWLQRRHSHLSHDPLWKGPHTCSPVSDGKWCSPWGHGDIGASLGVQPSNRRSFFFSKRDSENAVKLLWHLVFCRVYIHVHAYTHIYTQAYTHWRSMIFNSKILHPPSSHSLYSYSPAVPSGSIFNASPAWKESHYLRQILHLQISRLEATPEFRAPSPSRLGWGEADMGEGRLDSCFRLLARRFQL